MTDKPDEMIEPTVAAPPKPASQKPRKIRKGLLGAVIWALILIWMGAVLLAHSTGLLEQYLGAQQPVRVGDFWFLPVPWGVILLGIAALMLVEVLLRALIPAFRRGLLAKLILAVILLNLALGEAFPWQTIWSVVLIAIGCMFLIRALFGRRK
ncbi:MAG: hypothetical protein HPY76_03590 [Anaerolineae bacterium]|nr:hypothetical protein [Anaerolineae bacterium]